MGGEVEKKETCEKRFAGILFFEETEPDLAAAYVLFVMISIFIIIMIRTLQ